MHEFTCPSRGALILGSAIVAMHGLREQRRAGARLLKLGDCSEHPDVAECSRVIAALNKGEPVATSNADIVALMAHTRHVMRVTQQEWERIVLVTAQSALATS